MSLNLELSLNEHPIVVFQVAVATCQHHHFFLCLS